MAPSTARGVALGAIAGINVAVVYGILSEPFELSLGLIVVALGGGWLIGNAIAYGAWLGADHTTNRSLQYAGVAISVIAWIGALILAYLITQIMLPAASTPVSARLSLQGFLDYFVGLDLTRVIHLLSLLLMSFMAWRGAR